MDWMTIFVLWADAWQSHSFGMHMLNIVSGMTGACLYIVLTVPSLAMPKFNKEKRELELNFVGILLAGAICGLFVDYMAPVSLIAGAMFPAVLKLFFSKGVPLLFKVGIKKLASKIEDIDEDTE